MTPTPIDSAAPRVPPGRRRALAALALTLATLGAALGLAGPAGAADKPNILVI
ncbi:hypothetical protein [uncultured Thiodictyon sp.]|jgi:hypothetical protein|uniref:hypothetical protein n=1 Tax=uncultured Thiodictyon sp. TaxID=1846217 RepID=UPI0025CC34BD|nr:hypothetical protein [uncultured Thiodictyon sp.]